jgi:hypothetical protein
MVFWVMTPYGFAGGYQCIGGTYYLHGIITQKKTTI